MGASRDGNNGQFVVSLGSVGLPQGNIGLGVNVPHGLVCGLFCAFVLCVLLGFVYSVIKHFQKYKCPQCGRRYKIRKMLACSKNVEKVKASVHE